MHNNIFYKKDYNLYDMFINLYNTLVQGRLISGLQQTLELQEVILMGYGSFELN